MSDDKKICPFMSTGENKVLCNSECKLFRPGKSKFECVLQELQSISWNTKGAGNQNQNNGNQNNGGGYPQQY